MAVYAGVEVLVRVGLAVGRSVSVGDGTRGSVDDAVGSLGIPCEPLGVGDARAQAAIVNAQAAKSDCLLRPTFVKPIPPL